MNSDTALRFKFLVIGNTGVGKTALIQMYTQRTFSDRIVATLGVEMGRKVINLSGPQKANLEIWDTAGQEVFFALTKQYYRNADGCFVVFDITRRESFDKVAKWVEEAYSHSNNPNIVIILLGNKSDLSFRREVSTEEALLFAEQQRITYIELAAKHTNQVDEVFLKLSEEVKKRMEIPDGTKYNRPKGMRLKSQIRNDANNDTSSCCSNSSTLKDLLK
mmetsp:Transcript_29252/g.38462  ORF Transcript_29252/g.38462 Transcript_29252/m.38462 type:complete len:219 (-) Transcript_29252:114-770(-)